jgi:hypothetical protein
MPNNTRDDLIDIIEAISKAQIVALRRLRRKAQPKSTSDDAEPAKSMSHLDMAYDILRSAGRPMHISDIIALIAKRHGVTLDRESIVSALAKRVARKDRFIRTGPNTFSTLPES